MVWHELFSTHKHGCRKGGRHLKISAKKAVFLVSIEKKQISPLLAPPEKVLEKSTSGPTWKKSFRRPCTQACTITPFLQNTVLYYTWGSQPGVHVPLGVHLPIRRCTFKVSNRREICIYISLISKYLYIYQWILFSKAIICFFYLIFRNAEGVHGQRKVGNPCTTPSGNPVQQHQCGKQVIAGWQTVHGVFSQAITKSCQSHCQITNNIDKMLPKSSTFLSLNNLL